MFSKNLWTRASFLLLTMTALPAAAQQMNLDGYKVIGMTLENGKTLNQGEMIRSGANKSVAALQKDGNFCVYRLDPSDGKKGNFVKCTMTVGAPEKQAAKLVMQTDGNLVAYNAKGQPVWATDTYRGGDDKLGGRLALYDDATLVLLNKSSDKPIWKFEGGRHY